MTTGAPTSASPSALLPEPEVRPLTRRLAALVEAAAHDGRLAFRRLASTPGFTAVALGILAAGIGANTAIYSVVHAALFSPSLPYTEPSRTVRIYAEQSVESANRRPGTRWLSRPEYAEIGDQRDLFARTAAASDGQVWSLQADGRTTTVLGEVWSPALLELIDVAPQAGRMFLEEEDRPGSPSVVVVSHTAWQRLFGGDPRLVGKSLRLNGSLVTVVGVGPRDFKGTLVAFPTDFWIPWGTARNIDPDLESVDDRAVRELRVFAELRPGVTESHARARLDVLAAGLAASYPVTNEQITFRVFPAEAVRMDPLFDRAMGPLSIFLMTVVGLALLVACSNLAGMLLSRAQARQREVAVRLAIGAGRRRLVGELLAESVVLGLLGGACGVILALWAVDAFTTFDLPVPVTLTLNSEFGGGVLAFAFALSVGTSVLFGLAPALSATRCDVAEAMKNPGAVPAGPHRRLTLQNLLVVVQVAVSVVLLVAAGLFARSIAETERADVPFEPTRVVFVSLDCKRGGLRSEAEGRALLARYRERVAALPGVELVAIARQMPLSLWGMDEIPVARPAGAQAGGSRPAEPISYNVVTPSFFATLGIPVLRGRTFTDRDAASAPRVIVVNETMAREWFGRGDPIGAEVRVGAPGSQTPMQIVGVARDVPVLGLREPRRPGFYMPFDQAYRASVSVIARTSASPALVRDSLQRELGQLNPQVPILESRTMEQQLAGQSSLWRITGRFLSAFGLGTLALATVGLFGLVSFSVSRRTKEIGVRAALGATPGQVVRPVVRRALLLCAVGAAAGVAIAAVVTRPLARFLPGVNPADPVTYVGVVSILMAACVLAAWLPARRAARLDPIASLRQS